jgi:hypothetical protein
MSEVEGERTEYRYFHKKLKHQEKGSKAEMRKVMLLVLVVTAMLCLSFAAFGDYYAWIKAECNDSWYGGYEWDGPAWSNYYPDDWGRGRPLAPYQPSWYGCTSGRVWAWWPQGFGVKDVARQGDMRGGNSYWSQYYYSAHTLCIGATDWPLWTQGTGKHDEGRFLFGFDMSNFLNHQYSCPEDGNFRTYDPAATGFGPTELPATDGWGLGGDWTQPVGTGPTKGVFAPLRTTDTGYMSDAMGIAQPALLNLNNSTSLAGGAWSMYGGDAPTVSRVMFSIGWNKDARSPYWASTVSSIDDHREFTVWNLMPPIAQDGYASGDMVWGFHSGFNYNASVQWSPSRIRYWNVKVAHNRVDEIDDADPGAWGVGFNPGMGSWYVTSSIPNNYPTGRECVTGWWMIDEFGQGNDQFIYHGAAGDVDDPLISSFALTMAGGRNHVYFNFKPYDFNGVDAWDVATGGSAWPTLNNYYLQCSGYNYGPSGMQNLIIQMGPPASAEDWVLYK